MKVRMIQILEQDCHLKSQWVADFAGFLGAKTFEQPISQEQRTVSFAQMAQVSRQLGENMKKQEELQEKLSNTQGRQPRAAINAELKLLKEEALTLNQQNKGLERVSLVLSRH